MDRPDQFRTILAVLVLPTTLWSFKLAVCICVLRFNVVAALDLLSVL